MPTIHTDLETSDEMRALIESARRYRMTPRERDEQRISFAYGNAPHDSDLTKELVRSVAEELG